MPYFGHYYEEKVSVFFLKGKIKYLFPCEVRYEKFKQLVWAACDWYMLCLHVFC